MLLNTLLPMERYCSLLPVWNSVCSEELFLYMVYSLLYSGSDAFMCSNNSCNGARIKVSGVRSSCAALVKKFSRSIRICRSFSRSKFTDRSGYCGASERSSRVFSPNGRDKRMYISGKTSGKSCFPMDRYGENNFVGRKSTI